MTPASTNIQKQIFRNTDFILLNINAALVIIGYGIAVATHLESVAFMRIVKSFFLIVSVIGLFRGLHLNRNVIPTPSIIYIAVFCFWVFLMSFFSENIGYSIMRALGFLGPFVYVYVALHNLLNKFDVISLLKAFSRSMNLVYSIPVLSYIVSGAGFQQVNIYGTGSAAGHAFVSNHYGWAMSIFILTSIDIWLNMRTARWYRVYLFIMILVALYIVLISGNRASWLSLLFAILIMIIRLRNVRTDFKIFMALVPVVAIILFSRIPDSSLNTRLSDTESQFEKGEARFNTARLAINKFNDEKLLWFTGAGMFNYEKIIHGEGLGDYHNSYLEILFGGGIILFILFINFMVFRPLYNYVRFYSKYYTIFPPLIIIPFFESNLTGGQFLFFPWFIFMLLFNLTPVNEAQPAKIKFNKLQYQR